MNDGWDADPTAGFARRLGRSAKELEESKRDGTCPDIWELGNGDVAVIGRDHTRTYASRLPEGVVVGPGERLVVIPGLMLRVAKPDIPDA